MERITSKVNPKVREALKLKDDPKDRFIVEGFHLVQMAYDAGKLLTVFTTKETDYKNVKEFLCSDEVIRKLAFSKNPEGIIGISQAVTPSTEYTDSIIYLDNVQDPGNVGTILRTALAFGFKDIFLGHGCPSIYNPKVVAASQGAIFNLNFRKSSVADLKSFKEKGYKVISTSLGDSVSFKDFKEVEGKQIIVFGNEGQGICREILNISDYKIRIDIKNIDSLNVAVAAGIILNKFSKIA